MAWKIGWSSDAALFLSRLEQKEAKRIAKKLEDAAENPPYYFKRLRGEEDCKLRIGDYCAIVLLVHAESMVFVEKIDHRKRIYKTP